MQLEKYMRVARCPTCQGKRLNAQARAVRVGDKTLPEVCALPVGEVARWLEPGPTGLEEKLTPVQRTIAVEVLKELRGRIGFLLNVGLHYLTIERSAPTLSGGETQAHPAGRANRLRPRRRPRMFWMNRASASICRAGQRPTAAQPSKRLRDMGNTVVIVEHDEETMRAADYLVDFGPGPGSARRQR